MKTAVILSDTHGADITALLPIMREADYIFFAGDGYQRFTAAIGDMRAKLFAVAGNTDGAVAPYEQVVDIDGVRILVVHSHLFPTSYDLEDVGLSYGASLVIYGHTHIALRTQLEGITLFNPGSYRDSASYGYMVISGGKCYPNIVHVHSDQA